MATSSLSKNDEKNYFNVFILVDRKDAGVLPTSKGRVTGVFMLIFVFPFRFGSATCNLCRYTRVWKNFSRRSIYSVYGYCRDN